MSKPVAYILLGVATITWLGLLFAFDLFNRLGTTGIVFTLGAGAAFVIYLANDIRKKPDQ